MSGSVVKNVGKIMHWYVIAQTPEILLFRVQPVSFKLGFRCRSD